MWRPELIYCLNCFSKVKSDTILKQLSPHNVGTIFFRGSFTSYIKLYSFENSIIIKDIKFLHLGPFHGQEVAQASTNTGNGKLWEELICIM